MKESDNVEENDTLVEKSFPPIPRYKERSNRFRGNTGSFQVFCFSFLETIERL